MIRLKIEPVEYLNERTNEIYHIAGGVFSFEHSLKSISTWESLYQKPFLTTDEKTATELLDYFIIMCTKEIDPRLLTNKYQERLVEYIGSNPTATTIKTPEKGGSKSVLTSEVIYAMMVEANVPFECDKWNIRRLLMLLSVISVRQNPKKMSVNEIYKQNTDLNKQRKEKYKSRG